MPESGFSQKHSIEESISVLISGYLQGAFDNNKTYSEEAGRSLKKGNGQLMSIYRTNKEAIITEARIRGVDIKR